MDGMVGYSEYTRYKNMGYNASKVPWPGRYLGRILSFGTAQTNNYFVRGAGADAYPCAYFDSHSFSAWRPRDDQDRDQDQTDRRSPLQRK